MPKISPSNPICRSRRLLWKLVDVVLWYRCSLLIWLPPKVVIQERNMACNFIRTWFSESWISTDFSCRIMIFTILQSRSLGIGIVLYDRTKSIL